MSCTQNAAINYSNSYVNIAIGGSHDFDIDGDGTDDFRIHLTSNIATFEPLNGASVAGNATHVAGQSGNSIGSGTTYQAANTSIWLCNAGGGNWCGVLTNYAGVEFSIAGQTHYAWIQIQSNNVVSFRIQDLTVVGFAYEDVPNTAINAADGFVAASCSDGFLNNNEEQIDCGGPSCPACVNGPDVPTLSEWGLIILALFFMTLGILYLLQPQFNKLEKQES